MPIRVADYPGKLLRKSVIIFKTLI